MNKIGTYLHCSAFYIIENVHLDTRFYNLISASISQMSFPRHFFF